MPGKHALIIGGTGFISTYAVEEFAKAGYNVTIMTRGSTSDVHGDLVKTRLKVDCDKRKLFVNALKTSLIDVAASQGLDSVPDKWDVVVDFICFDPVHAEDVVAGLSGLTNLFVYISTDSVYEVCKPQPGMNLPGFSGHTEQFDELLDLPAKAIEKIDDYGYNKLLAEHVFRRAGSEALPYCALRLPDVMGEREYPRCRHLQYQARVMLGLPVYINHEKHRYMATDIGVAPMSAAINSSDTTTQQESKDAQSATTITTTSVPASSATSHLSPTPPNAKLLSFVYAGDVATAALRLAETAYLHRQGKDENNTWPTLCGEAFNIGSPECVTLQQYVEIIGQAIGRTPYFFSTGKQRLRTIKYSQFAHENPSKAPKEASMCPPASSYTRILANVLTKPLSYTSVERVALSMLAHGLHDNAGAQLLEKHGLKPWSNTEVPSTFVAKLYSNGFEVDSDSSSSSDSDSTSASDRDDSDEDIAVAPSATTDANVTTVVDNTSTAFATTDSSATAVTPVTISAMDLSRRERHEDDDMYSYLPSVDQGHISMQKAMRMIPGWSPTPLREWCMRMSVWYAHACVLDILDVDAASRVRKMMKSTLLKAKRMRR